jgi:hypothetical protein
MARVRKPPKFLNCERLVGNFSRWRRAKDAGKTQGSAERQRASKSLKRSCRTRIRGGGVDWRHGQVAELVSRVRRSGMDRKENFSRKKKDNGLVWLFEPLEGVPRYLCRKLFFLDAAYIGERLYLALVERGEPWNGMMVCTARENHASLLSDFPQLTSHEILGKWLYISQSHPEFEHVAQQLVALSVEQDRRLGVDTNKTKKPKTTKGSKDSKNAKNSAERPKAKKRLVKVDGSSFTVD